MKLNIRVDCDANALYVGKVVILSWSANTVESCGDVSVFNKLAKIAHEVLSDLACMSEEELDDAMKEFSSGIKSCLASM